MDFPSENWVYNDWDDFDTASANVAGDYTLEVFAPLRNTGRILDHFRCVIGKAQASGDQRQPNGHDSRILEYFRAVLGGSKPTTGHTVLHG